MSQPQLLLPLLCVLVSIQDNGSFFWDTTLTPIELFCKKKEKML
jgi:hypothetical protein